MTCQVNLSGSRNSEANAPNAAQHPHGLQSVTPADINIVYKRKSQWVKEQIPSPAGREVSRHSHTSLRRSCPVLQHVPSFPSPSPGRHSAGTAQRSTEQLLEPNPGCWKGRAAIPLARCCPAARGLPSVQSICRGSHSKLSQQCCPTEMEKSFKFQ